MTWGMGWVRTGAAAVAVGIAGLAFAACGSSSTPADAVTESAQSNAQAYIYCATYESTLGRAGLPSSAPNPFDEMTPAQLRQLTVDMAKLHEAQSSQNTAAEQTAGAAINLDCVSY